MGEYTITVTSATNEATVSPDVEFFHKDNLNLPDEVDMKFNSIDSDIRSLLSIGSYVLVELDGTAIFYGLIDNTDSLDAGGRVVHATSLDFSLGKDPSADTTWQSTASATIFTSLIGSASKISTGSIAAGVTTDFKSKGGISLFNSITNLLLKTGQDYEIDFSSSPGTTSMDIVDHRGVSTPTVFLNDGIEIENLRYNESYPQGNSVTVYGKGDGASQIKSSAGAGQDATSKATYGTITKTIIDRTIISQTEADFRANQEVAKIKDPTKIYSFILKDISLNIGTGDEIILSSQVHDISNEQVRVTQVKRGYSNNEEFVQLQVCNSAYSQLLKDLRVEKTIKAAIESRTNMQGSGNQNLFGQGINAKSTQSCKIPFYVSSNFEDEAGNINIKGINVSYDIDPYNQQYGTASFDGADPQVQNTSGDDDATISGTIADNDDFGLSDDAQMSFVSSSSEASWTTKVTFNNVTGAFTLITITLIPDSAGGNEYNIRVRNTDTSENYPTDNGVNVSPSSAGDHIAITIMVPDNISSDDLAVQAKTDDGFDMYAMFNSFGEHSHGNGTIGADDHSHPDGSYDINAADIDDISIGDDIDEAGSVNASSVNLYLDFWNGSSWINKFGIVNTGATIDQGVDMSNSGAFPDATGWWRVRIEPITATPDFAQGVVELINYMDN